MLVISALCSVVYYSYVQFYCVLKFMIVKYKCIVYCSTVVMDKCIVYCSTVVLDKCNVYCSTVVMDKCIVYCSTVVMDKCNVYCSTVVMDKCIGIIYSKGRIRLVYLNKK